MMIITIWHQCYGISKIFFIADNFKQQTADFMQCTLPLIAMSSGVCLHRRSSTTQTTAIIFIWYNDFFLFLGLINIYTRFYRKFEPVLKNEYLSQLELLVSLSISLVNNKARKICKTWFYLFWVNEWLFFVLFLLFNIYTCWVSAVEQWFSKLGLWFFGKAQFTPPNQHIKLFTSTLSNFGSVEEYVTYQKI